jgi:integrase
MTSQNVVRSKSGLPSGNLPHVADACLHRRWRCRLLATRSPSPPHLPAPSRRDAVGTIGELVGHDDLVTTARTYTHVVADEGELDYAVLLA